MENPQRVFEPVPLKVWNPYLIYSTLICTDVTYKKRYGSGEAISDIYSHPSLLVSGLGNTNPDGTIEFQFEDFGSFGCVTTEEHYEGIVIVSKNMVFTATPKSKAPVFLTWNYDAIQKQFEVNDVTVDLMPITTISRRTYENRYLLKIQVHSWNPDSTPAPNIHFGWNCIVEVVGVDKIV